MSACFTCGIDHGDAHTLLAERNAAIVERDVLKAENATLRAKLADAAKTGDGVWEWVPKPKYDALTEENAHLRLAVEGLKEESRELRATIERTREEVQNHQHLNNYGSCRFCAILAILRSDAVVHLEDGKETE